MEVHEQPRIWMTNYEVIISGDGLTQVDFPTSSACNEYLHGKEVILQEGKMYCRKCFEKVFALKCVFCGKLINGLDRGSFVYHNDQVWHKECFNFSACRNSSQRWELIQKKGFVHCKGCSESEKFQIC